MAGSGERLSDCPGLTASSATADGLGAGRKRLAMPETTMPGWRPSSGASRETVPKIRWRKGDDDALYDGRAGWEGLCQPLPLVSPRESQGTHTSKTTSAASRPPIEWPTSTTSVVGDSW